MVGSNNNTVLGERGKGHSETNRTRAGPEQAPNHTGTQKEWPQNPQLRAGGGEKPRNGDGRRKKTQLRQKKKKNWTHSKPDKRDA